MRSRTGLVSPVENQARGIAKYPRLRVRDTECGVIAILAAGKTLQKKRKNNVGWRIEELEAVAEENLG